MTELAEIISRTIAQLDTDEDVEEAMALLAELLAADSCYSATQQTVTGPDGWAVPVGSPPLAMQ